MHLVIVCYCEHGSSVQNPSIIPLNPGCFVGTLTETVAQQSELVQLDDSPELDDNVYFLPKKI